MFEAKERAIIGVESFPIWFKGEFETIFWVCSKLWLMYYNIYLD